MDESTRQATKERYLLDIDAVDLSQTWADAEAIEAVNPHRGEMRQLDRVVWWKDDRSAAIGIKEIREDEFWVSGHIPGRPLFPGVLQIEAGAQLSSFVMTERLTDAPFLGFTRVTDGSFRGQVVPGDTLVLCTREVKVNRRRFITDIQGIVNDKIVFEARITGMGF
ncbi:MAG: beta-hydroxyacyl-ACP dehydratase [Planctomycetota bacterium]|nr:beta-hydroxyacyl-ACP dehydratase [Planctomycetota bacterium]